MFWTRHVDQLRTHPVLIDSDVTDTFIIRKQ